MDFLMQSAFFLIRIDYMWLSDATQASIVGIGRTGWARRFGLRAAFGDTAREAGHFGGRGLDTIGRALTRAAMLAERRIRGRIGHRLRVVRKDGAPIMASQPVVGRPRSGCMEEVSDG
jgi:hypothetical protein